MNETSLLNEYQKLCPGITKVFVIPQIPQKNRDTSFALPVILRSPDFHRDKFHDEGSLNLFQSCIRQVQFCTWHSQEILLRQLADQNDNCETRERLSR